jgi:hypothetical protein
MQPKATRRLFARNCNGLSEQGAHHRQRREWLPHRRIEFRDALPHLAAIPAPIPKSRVPNNQSRRLRAETGAACGFVPGLVRDTPRTAFRGRRAICRALPPLAAYGCGSRRWLIAGHAVKETAPLVPAACSTAPFVRAAPPRDTSHAAAGRNQILQTVHTHPFRPGALHDQLNELVEPSLTQSIAAQRFGLGVSIDDPMHYLAIT